MRRALTWSAGIAVAWSGAASRTAAALIDLRWCFGGPHGLSDDVELQHARPGCVRRALERWTLSRAAWLTDRGRGVRAGRWLRVALFVGDRRPGRSPGPAERWLDRMITAGRVDWTGGPERLP